MAIAGDWMAGGGRVRQGVLRLLAIFLILGGIVFLAGPAILLLRDGGGLIDDTRAYFGAGTAERVPTVSRASCVEQTYGSMGSTRGFRSRSWDCTFYLKLYEPVEVAVPAAQAAAAPEAKAMAPPSYEGLSQEEAMAAHQAYEKWVLEHNERLHEQNVADMERYFRESRLPDPAIRAAQSISNLERELPFHPRDPLPTLRRLSAEGEPPRFGMVWSGGALAWQWLGWALFSFLFLAFGTACLYAARVGWRRTRRPLTSTAA